MMKQFMKWMKNNQTRFLKASTLYVMMKIINDKYTLRSIYFNLFRGSERNRLRKKNVCINLKVW